jgi:methanogenic corrinoid protein MtbC1
MDGLLSALKKCQCLPKLEFGTIKNGDERMIKKHGEHLKKLVQLIVELKEQQALKEISDLLDSGCDPFAILDSSIQGMQEVGRRFEEGTYFISALIMAGAIMGQTTELLEPFLKGEQTEDVKGKMILGTVAGDIHDLGKNLFATLARYKGIKIIDLGVDVPADKFLSEAVLLKPDAIGISCVLSTAWPELKETIAFLKKELSETCPPIIIGGSGIDENVSNHVASDYWVRDASKGLKICQQLITN